MLHLLIVQCEVSCEVQGNLEEMLEYLDEEHGHVSLPDTNHDIKNSRYQLIGGSSPAVLGRYCFDPWLIKVDGVCKELYRIDNYVKQRPAYAFGVSIKYCQYD